MKLRKHYRHAMAIAASITMLAGSLWLTEDMPYVEAAEPEKSVCEQHVYEQKSSEVEATPMAVDAGESNVVATVTCNGTTTDYGSFEDAVNAANAAAGDVTVELLQEVNLTADIGIGAKHAMIFNLNGNTINVGDHQIYTQNEGKVTFTGDGVIKGTATANVADSYPLYIFSGSNVALDGVKIQADYGVYTCGILDIKKADIQTKNTGLAVNQEAQVTIGSSQEVAKDSVKILSQLGNCISTQAAQGEPGMKVTINGGTFTASKPTAWNGGPIYWASHGTLTINGGTFEGLNNISAAIYQKNGTVNINDGTFFDKDAIKLGAEASDTTEIVLNINGGTFKGDRSAIYFKTTSSGLNCTKYDINIKNGDFSHTKADDQTIYKSVASGVIVPNMSVSGGVFDTEVKDEYCAEGFLPAVYDAATDKYTVAPAVAEIVTGSSVQKFTSLGDALKAAQEGDTVRIVKNTEIKKGEKLTIKEGISVEVMAGANLMNNGEIIVRGTLKINKGGSVTDGDNGIIDIYGTVDNDGNALDEKGVKYHIKSLEFEQSEMSLVVGEKIQLKAKKTPVNAVEDIEYSVDAKGVISIDKYGNVTAIGVGKVTVTAKSGDIETTCTIEVTKKPEFSKPDDSTIDKNGGSDKPNSGKSNAQSKDSEKKTIKTAKKTDTVKTADTANIYLWGLIAIGALLMAAEVILIRRRLRYRKN